VSYYIIASTVTESGKAVDPRVLAKTYGRVEVEMLTALLKRDQGRESKATWGPQVFFVSEQQLDNEHEIRKAVAGFEVDGPDPKDAAEIEILRSFLSREEDDGDLKRHMIQRVLVEDGGFEHMWKDTMLEWVMKGAHKPGETENVLGVGGDLETFERRLAEVKAEHQEMFEQWRAAREATEK
jgi:hypothetical protein